MLMRKKLLSSLVVSYIKKNLQTSFNDNILSTKEIGPLLLTIKCKTIKSALFKSLNAKMKIEKLLYRTSKANFSESYKDNEMYESFFDKALAKLKDKQNPNNIIENRYFVEALSLFSRFSNKELKKDFLVFIDMYFKNVKNINSLTSEEFPIFVDSISKFKLDEEKLKILDEYLSKKVKEDNTSVRTKLIVFESLYYFTINECELSKTFAEIFQFIEKNINQLNKTDTMDLCKNLLYFKPEGIQPISKVLTDFLIEKTKEPKKNFTLFQFCPKLLTNVSESKALEFQNALSNYLLKFEKDCHSVPFSPELLICVLSNTLTYLNFDQKVFEIFIPYFYRNLSSLQDDFFNELLFMVLKYDATLYKDSPKVELLVKNCLIMIKSCSNRLHLLEKNGLIKESKYIHEQNKKLNECFEKWKLERKKSTNLKEEKYHVLFDELISKNMMVYPFASLNYTTDLIEKIFQNFTLLVKL